MGRLENSKLDKSINRKALTFAAEVVSNVSNARLEIQPADEVTNQIDAQGLESEISSAQKLAALMRAIGCLKCDLEERIAELTYEVVCHANGFDGQFTAFEGVYTVIPYHTVVYEPTDGSFADGVFTAAKTGYYDMSAYFTNPLVIAPVGTQLSLMLGSSYDVEQADSIIMNTDTTQLQGSRTVYCNAGGEISASLSHNYAGDIDFNSVAYPGAGGYISISYAGSIRSATNL